MKIMNDRKQKTLVILNVLMNARGYLTTKQIMDRAQCDRKTVYKAVDMLEVSGFGIEVFKDGGGNNCNKYRYVGLYGV